MERLIQEIYADSPWRMLIGCIMLNQTTSKQVYKIHEEFFRRYPDAAEAERADPNEMSELLAPLGLKNNRTKTIRRFSSDWINLDWKNPIELFGIGKYASDSYEIFIKKNLNVEPTDKVLLKYLKDNKVDTIYIKP